MLQGASLCLTSKLRTTWTRAQGPVELLLLPYIRHFGHLVVKHIVCDELESCETMLLEIPVPLSTNINTLDKRFC